VVGRPYSSAGGKMVHARVQYIGQAAMAVSRLAISTSADRVDSPGEAGECSCSPRPRPVPGLGSQTFLTSPLTLRSARSSFLQWPERLHHLRQSCHSISQYRGKTRPKGLPIESSEGLNSRRDQSRQSKSLTRCNGIIGGGVSTRRRCFDECSQLRRSPTPRSLCGMAICLPWRVRVGSYLGGGSRLRMPSWICCGRRG